MAKEKKKDIPKPKKDESYWDRKQREYDKRKQK